MQSCLEKKGIEERKEETLRSDYNANNVYSAEHKDAQSDGDAQGKGTNHGGHGHWLPDCSKPTGMIDYSNFDTENGGGLYDIEGRNGIGGRERALANSLYQKGNYEYSSNLVNTEKNVAEGQYQTY